MTRRVRSQWHATAATRREHAAAVRGLRLATEHVLAVSNSRVPLDEATLERSGAASVDEPSLRAAVSYDTPYAVVQHEDLTLRHDPGRQAKYLETAVHSQRTVVRDLIAAALREELSR